MTKNSTSLKQNMYDQRVPSDVDILFIIPIIFVSDYLSLPNLAY